MNILNQKKKAFWGIVVGVTILLGSIIGVQVSERVDSGTYKICQKLNGDLIVLDRAGWHWTGFVSNITEYKIGGTYYFTDKEVTTEKTDAAVRTRCNDTTEIAVSGSLQYRLPTANEDRINLHKIYNRNYNNMISGVIKTPVLEAIVNTAPFFKGEDAAFNDRNNFVETIKKQLTEGAYRSKKIAEKIVDMDGNEFIETKTEMIKDEDGNPIISNQSKIKTFGIEVVALSIINIDLDERAMKLLDQKKESEFKRIAARAAAEEAKQGKITAEENAKRMVAEAKAEEDIAKMRAIVSAEREKEVAETLAKQEYNVAKTAAEKELATATLRKQAAEEDAKAMTIMKDAEARANAKMVQAGLTPREKAEIEKEKAIGVARELSKINVPQIIVTGGANGGINPLDMVGVNQALEITNKLK